MTVVELINLLKTFDESLTVLADYDTNPLYVYMSQVGDEKCVIIGGQYEQPRSERRSKF